MRRYICHALLLACCFAITAVAQDTTQNLAPAASPDQTAVSQSLIQQEIAGWDARKSGDLPFFEDNVPKDFKATMSNGTVEDKGDIRDRLKHYPLDSYNARNFNVAFPTASTAQVAYDVDFSGRNPDGSRFQGTRHVVSDYQLRNGAWENTRVNWQAQ